MASGGFGWEVFTRVSSWCWSFSRLHLGPTATLFPLHIFYGIGANWYQIQKKTYTKSFQILCRKKISMLTGLKVSPLACKCVFYRPDHNTNGGPHENELWSWNAKMKYPMNKAQKVDEKNGVICLVIMFTSRAMVIKLYFLLMTAKKLVTV